MHTIPNVNTSSITTATCLVMNSMGIRCAKYHIRELVKYSTIIVSITNAL